jgi:type VI secretion system secreted protein Hcp
MAEGKKYFLCKIEGVEGETADAAFPGYFEIDDWGWDAYMQSTAQTGSGMVAGKCQLGSFSFSKVNDKASNKMLHKVCTGEAIPSVELVARKQGTAGGGLKQFAKYTFMNVVLTGCNDGGGDGAGIPVERVEMAFEGIKFEYDKFNPDGSSDGWISAEFNSKTNLLA